MPIDTSSLTTQQQATAIYVAYFDRAPDPAGLEFWTEQLEGGQSLAEVATTFSNAAETKEKFPFFDAPDTASGSDFIDQVYDNLFNRPPDTAGKDFWTNELESGSTPVGEIILAIIQGAQDQASGGFPDSETVNNKIEVGLDWVESATAAGIGADGERIAEEDADGNFVINNPDAFNSATSVLDVVDGTDASVADAQDSTDAFFAGTDPALTGETPTLTEALNNLSTAETSLSDRLAELDVDTDGDGEVEVEAPDATAANVEAAATAQEGNVDGLIAGDFSGAGAATKEGLITDARADAQTAIDEATTALTDAESTAGTAVVSAVETAQVRADELETAIDAAQAAATDQSGEIAKFNTVNSANTAAVAGNTDGTAATAENDELTIGGNTAATLNANGTFEVETGFNTTTVDGFDALLAAVQANTDAAIAEEDARDTLDSAAADVINEEDADADASAAQVAASDVVDDTATDADGNAVVTLDFSKPVAAIGGDDPAVAVTAATTEVATLSLSDTLLAGDPDGAGLTFSDVADADVTVSLATGDTEVEAATKIKSAIEAASGSLYDVSINADSTKVTLTAKEAGDKTNVTLTVNDGANTTSSSAGLPVPADLTVAADDEGVNEINTVTFNALADGETVTVDTQTFTATGDVTANDLATAFANNDDTSVADSFNGTTSTPDWIAGTANGADLAFTSADTGDPSDIGVSATAATSTATEADAVTTAQDDLEAAEQDLSDLNEAITNWQDATALNDEIEGLEDAETTAREAITDDEADGGLGLNLLDFGDAFTTNDDVTVFNDDTDPVSLTNFGVSGEDKIFFGEEFSLAQIPDGSDINDNVGDIAALEILFQEDGNDLVLYAEQETFGGNSAGSSDVTTVTLVGVSADDVSFSGGVLSAGGDTIA